MDQLHQGISEEVVCPSERAVILLQVNKTYWPQHQSTDQPWNSIIIFQNRREQIPGEKCDF